MTAFILPAPLHAQLAAEARGAFPRECCGLIEGVRQGGAIEAVRLHPVANLAERADRFEIDPVEQFRLLRALRGTERGIVGCYHSHPNGEAHPSDRDRENAGEEDFVWLIAGVRDGMADEIAAFVFAGARFHAVELHVR